MKIHRLRSHGEYLAHTARDSQRLSHHMDVINSLVPATQTEFSFAGYSYTAGHDVKFIVDFQHSGDSGRVIWRERVACPVTGFNNRMRATFHIFDLEMEAYPDSAIYITEQVTPIYTYFAERFRNVTGSEYLGDKVPYGELDERGVRNETLCSLSFPDEAFDIVVSLDVLEHIPDYTTAFKECARVLKPGGRLLWSVPFAPNSPSNIIRARLGDGGVVEHLLPAEYHGDPLSQAGVLCFTHFGWEMLEQVKAAGFADAYAACFHSLEFGYLGGEQFIFIATR